MNSDELIKEWDRQVEERKERAVVSPMSAKEFIDGQNFKVQMRAMLMRPCTIPYG